MYFPESCSWVYSHGRGIIFMILASTYLIIWSQGGHCAKIYSLWLIGWYRLWLWSAFPLALSSNEMDRGYTSVCFGYLLLSSGNSLLLCIIFLPYSSLNYCAIAQTGTYKEPCACIEGSLPIGWYVWRTSSVSVLLVTEKNLNCFFVFVVTEPFFFKSLTVLPKSGIFLIVKDGL